MMILIWLIIGYAIYYFLTNKGVAVSHLNRNNNAEEILRQRYVNGEIDEVTYEKMMKTIK